VVLSRLNVLCFSAQAACGDLDVARRFGSVAYAAEADATIQFNRASLSEEIC
jgi:hypothetical protein